MIRSVSSAYVLISRLSLTTRSVQVQNLLNEQVVAPGCICRDGENNIPWKESNTLAEEVYAPRYIDGAGRVGNITLCVALINSEKLIQTDHGFSTFEASGHAGTLSVLSR